MTLSDRPSAASTRSNAAKNSTHVGMLTGESNKVGTRMARPIGSPMAAMSHKWKRMQCFTEFPNALNWVCWYSTWKSQRCCCYVCGCGCLGVDRDGTRPNKLRKTTLCDDRIYPPLVLGTCQEVMGGRLTKAVWVSTSVPRSTQRLLSRQQPFKASRVIPRQPEAKRVVSVSQLSKTMDSS